MGRIPRLLALLAVFVACGPGLVHLDVKKARKIEIGLIGGGNSICINDGVPEVRALVTYDNGKMIETRTPGNPRGTLRFMELEWGSDLGMIGQDGRLQLPDLLVWHDRQFTIRVGVPGRPELLAELPLTPRFDCGGIAGFGGQGGAGGYTGGDGGNGDHGPRVTVALAYVDTKLNGRLVLARVTAGSQASYYLIDRRGTAAQFAVSARGGDGGSGGGGESGSSGSAGSSGASGTSGATCGNGGDGGDGTDGGDATDGGAGGNGGDGGNGGEVIVVYPEAFPELPSALVYDVSGGDAGAAGYGGSGGSGGAGGSGGYGGSAGSTTNSDGSTCSTSPGAPGQDGRRGRDGNSGSNGGSGRSGAPGVVSSRNASVDELFAAEIQAGWPIVREE